MISALEDQIYLKNLENIANLLMLNPKFDILISKMSFASLETKRKNKVA